MTRIEKLSKGKSMALKAKSSDTDESSEDEDSKMKSYITRQFKSLRRMPMLKDLAKTASNPVRFSSKAKTKGRRMLGMAVSTLFPLGQSDFGVKASDT